MALPTNAFTTYDAVGIREDLADLISMISPVDTMFYSSLGEGGASNTKVEWQIDSLANAASNAHLEGDNESPEAISPTTRVYNYTQIQKKVFNISNTEEAVKKAGRKSEVNYQTAKKSKELARDVEYAFLQESFASPEQGSESVARKMKGILNWISTNSVNANSNSLTQAMFDECIQDIYTSGGGPSFTAYAHPIQIAKIADFPNASSKNYRMMVEQGKLPAYVDVYVNNFGTVQIKVHRLMPNNQILIVTDPYKGKRGTLRNTHRQKLGITGDNQTWVIRVEHTLRNLNEAGCGKIYGLATS